MINDTVKKETRYIASFCAVLSLLMQAVFIILGKWDYRVLLGNLLSLAVATGNFFIMGITVQKAISLNEDDRIKLIRSSQKKRKICMFALLAIGVVLPIFNTIAVIVPVFFSRIAVFFRLAKKDKKEVTDK